jgi:hypothetical protein
MAITNHDRVGKALELLNTGLKPFVERELKSCYAQNWFSEVKQSLAGTQLQLLGTEQKPQWDVAALLTSFGISGTMFSAKPSDRLNARW